MALIYSTCLKARITVNAFFCSNGKKRARERQATILWKEKAELFCFPYWKDNTEISEELLWHITQRHYPHGAALGEQNPPAPSEQPCFGEGDVLCASLSPLARHLQCLPVALMRVASAIFIQLRMYQLIFKVSVLEFSAILDIRTTLADMTEGPWKSCVLLERQLEGRWVMWREPNCIRGLCL